MTNIYSNIYQFNNKSLKTALKFLKNNNIVGLPTETVYGLAGNAYSNTAVKKIYKLKKRSRKNPLIIHYYSLKDAEKDISINNNLRKLYKRFCPGPLTFIVKRKKNSKIDKISTSGLRTVAVRFPKHPITRKLLKKLSFPIAMPSANKSKSISPISAYDVADELGKTLKIILNGGRSNIGIESTVVDIRRKIKILRPGIISSRNLRAVLNKKINTVEKTKNILSPGQQSKHYSPGIPIIMNAKKPPQKYAYIIFGKKDIKGNNIFNLSKKSNLKEAAKNLYKTFRLIKRKKFKKIFIMKIPNRDIGIAINDRIKRASNE